jgi:hypothetical protein
MRVLRQSPQFLVVWKAEQIWIGRI